MLLRRIPAPPTSPPPDPYNPLFLLLLLSLLPGGAKPDSSRGGEGPVSTTQCRLDEADHCFQELFNHMPVCSSAELTFRCQHFNVLDTCFRQSNIMCLPSAVGQTAKLAYRRKLNECSKDAHKKYRQTSQQKSWSAKSSSSNRSPSPPNEIQFISLFGYLQSQCRRKSNSDNGPEGEMTAVMSATSQSGQGRRSKEGEEPTSAEQRQASVRSNCSTHELKELIGSCEAEMKQKLPSANTGGKRKHVVVDLERHQLLRYSKLLANVHCLNSNKPLPTSRVKLEASSRLLIYPETRRNDECLMVRSVSTAHSHYIQSNLRIIPSLGPLGYIPTAPEVLLPNNNDQVLVREA
jgi:hypothetical protein